MSRAVRCSKKDEQVLNDITVARGKYCEVHKHGVLGTAVVLFSSARFKAAMLKFMEIRERGDKAIWKVGAHQATVQEHVGKNSKRGIFIYWGRNVEKIAPCSAATVAHHVDVVAREVHVSLALGVQPPRVDQVPVPFRR
eukprot:TRINITY_DN8537_c0_g1_i1.p1 TRINITY_DN8537_c0_g1~~TRINITY_DN8537_c0_g1_i1.p1  ORF type:complete len:139 (+),score=18.78 TRINITY_DN8537_c0_g1_i1:134-550(+)